MSKDKPDLVTLLGALKEFYEGSTTDSKEDKPSGSQEDGKEDREEAGKESSKEETSTKNSEGVSKQSETQNPEPESKPEPKPESDSKLKSEKQPEPTPQPEGGKGPDKTAGDGEPQGNKGTTEDTSTSGQENQKEDYTQEEVDSIIKLGEDRGFAKESVSGLFELISRDKLTDNQGNFSEEKLNTTLDFLEAIVLRKKEPAAKKKNYKYNPLDTSSTGFGKYLKGDK